MSESVRHQVAFQETMKRLYGEIERMIYAAEIACHSDKNGDGCDAGCPFESSNGVHCDLKFLRLTLGDHFEQHDCMRECPR